MNATFLKKMAMPMAVAVLGIAGAFGTVSMKGNESLVNKTGYRIINGVCQETSVMCRTEDGVTCKLGFATLWGKNNPSDANCPIPLFHIPQQ